MMVSPVREPALTDLADIRMDAVGGAQPLVAFIKFDIRAGVVVGGIRKVVEHHVVGDRGKLRIGEFLKWPLQENDLTRHLGSVLGQYRTIGGLKPEGSGEVGGSRSRRQYR